MTRSKLKTIIKEIIKRILVKKEASLAPIGPTNDRKSPLSTLDTLDTLNEGYSGNKSDVFENNKEWIIHKGIRDNKSSRVTVHFLEDKKVKNIWFEVNYKGICKNDGSNNDRMDKWGKKAASIWSRIAKNKYKNPELTEIGNPIKKTWIECFIEALQSEEMKPFVKKTGYEKKSSGIVDPINFTPRV